MKLIKFISPDELKGKTAIAPHPNFDGVFYINCEKRIIRGAHVEILPDDPSVIDLTLIAYNEMPDTFPINSLNERVLYYCHDHRIKTHHSNVERRFRQLKDERGRINYEYDGKIHAYKKLPLPERTFQEQIIYPKC
jgi:hypothetical protein